MQTAIWGNFNTIKETIAQYARTALDNKWITEDQCAGIIEKLEKDTLTIGVIGQMKCGKSTFLNAFLFQDTILPVASTPMTAALSFITYGEKKEILVEFYDESEWKETENLAAIPGEDSKFQAARELVNKARNLGGEKNSLLGRKKPDSFEKLEDYVGADGRYTPITKSVTIYYPDERLKGVSVVDTPGFNDPIKSREDRTAQFLSQADVVILLVYAGRAFDKTDKEILFEKVKNVGVGKILIAINKYDVEVAAGKPNGGITKYAIEQINKGAREKNDPVLNDLLKNPTPVLFSAEMALLAQMSLDKVLADETLSFDLNRFYEDFEINSQDALLERSKIKEIEKEIDVILTKNKVEILVRKPVNEIQARIDAKKTEYSALTNTLSIEKKNMQLNKEELQKKLKEYEDVKKKISNIIESKGKDMDEFIKEQKENMHRNLKTERNIRDDRLRRLIDQGKRRDIENDIRTEVRSLNAQIYDITKKTHNSIKTEFKAVSDVTISKLEESIRLFTDDNEKSQGYILQCRDEISKFNDFSIEDLFPVTEDFKKFREWWHFKDTKKKWVDDLLSEDEITELTSRLKEKADEFIQFFRKRFLEDLVNPIIESIKNIEKEGFNRENELKLIETKISENEGNIKEIAKKLEEVNEYIKKLPL
jgi:hypothetical protein